MIAELSAANGSEDWDELRARFGGTLGLHDPVPGAVLRRAMADATFAHRLLVSRGSPGFLAALIEDPGNRAYEAADTALTGEPGPRPSELPGAVRTVADTRPNTDLAKSAAAALVAWGKAGFTHVDAPEYAARRAACEACPHLAQAPDQLVYKVRARRNADMRVCNLCGCIAARKARLSSEMCPGADPADPTRSRWGQRIEDTRGLGLG